MRKNKEHRKLIIIRCTREMSSVYSESLLPESPLITEDLKDLRMEVPAIDLFTPLEVAAISCVLEESLEQLVTIGFMISASVDPRWDERFKTVDEMYGMPDEPKTIFRKDMDLLPVVPTAAEKLQRDKCVEIAFVTALDQLERASTWNSRKKFYFCISVLRNSRNQTVNSRMRCASHIYPFVLYIYVAFSNYVCKVLERILCGIRETRKFDNLQEEIDKIAKKQEDEHSLETSAQVWITQAAHLREMLEYNKNAMKEDTERTIKLAQESDAQVDHTTFLNSGKLGYAERWAKARLEQQEIKLQLQKIDMLNKLSEYSKEYNAEQVISPEISAYLETDIEEKEKQIVTWTTRYNEELVQQQQKIDELKEKVERQKLKIDEMRSLRDKRQDLIDEYIIEEKRLREEADHRGKLYKAATIIQSLWRGYMVRQELGKYKNLRKRLKKRKRLSKIKKKQKAKI